jgi:hypothetical protein
MNMACIVAAFPSKQTASGNLSAPDGNLLEWFASGQPTPIK